MLYVSLSDIFRIHISRQNDEQLTDLSVRIAAGIKNCMQSLDELTQSLT